MRPNDTADISSRADVDDPADLGRRLGSALRRSGAVSVDGFDRAVAAVDASHYLLTPRAVVTPEGIDEAGGCYLAPKSVA